MQMEQFLFVFMERQVAVIKSSTESLLRGVVEEEWLLNIND